MANIYWQQFNGLSDSLFSGVRNSFYKMVGIDIHSKPGAFTVNQKLTKHSDTTITALCRVTIPVSDGSKLWFSYTNGKIWRESGGTYTLVYTLNAVGGGVPEVGAGTTGCLGAKEYNSFIYWATQSRLHRIAVANIGSAASWTSNAIPNWQTFSITDAEFHPMVIQNASLFIGDGNYVSSVGSTAAFTPNALNIVAPTRIKCMAPTDIDLVIGTIIATSVNFCWIIRWDTVQTAWQYSEPVWENGINSFLWDGSVLLAQAGTYGKLYYYDGSRLQDYKRIPGDWSPTKYGEIFPNATGILRGIPIFGFSNGSGNPCEQGIYSIGSYSKDYSKVLSLDYVISEDVVSSISIGAIIVDGQNVYVSWQNGSTFGIDKLDYSAKYGSAYLETLRITPDAVGSVQTARVFANYQSLPAGTTITFSYKENNAASYVDLATVNDTEGKRLYAELTIEARVYQFKAAIAVSTNDAPVFELLGVEFV